MDNTRLFPVVLFGLFKNSGGMHVSRPGKVFLEPIEQHTAFLHGPHAAPQAFLYGFSYTGQQGACRKGMARMAPEPYNISFNKPDQCAMAFGAGERCELTLVNDSHRKSVI